MLNLERVIEKMKTKRKIFVSEADFQLEMAWVIKEEYPKARVRLEYCPVFDPSIHIDILVIMEEKWYPIELKYKTRKYQKVIDGEMYNLKNQAAQDVGRYLYLKDIQRIERIKENIPEFGRGYTIFLTNDLTYTLAPSREKIYYAEMALADGMTKHGKLSWGESSSAWQNQQLMKPIFLAGNYLIEWKEYSRIDKDRGGLFKYVMNEIG